MLRCDFEIVKSDYHEITIRDCNLGRTSVTNDVEAVVEHLRAQGLLPKDCRLFYYDSEGHRDEILWDETGFVGYGLL